MNGQHVDSLITDPAVFQEPWVPGDFRHRDAELNQISTTLRPLLEGEPAGDVFVWGPSGSGKSSAARYLLGELHTELGEVDAHYVRCWSNQTRHRVLYALLDSVGSTAGVNRTGVSASELLDRVEAAVDRPTVLVLDEVDMLTDPDVLYDLYHIQDLALFLVANDEQRVLSRLDTRLQSRLGNATSVSFDRYDVDALVSILAQRVEHGVAPGVLTREHLSTIADLAAGDARTAIRILATAVRSVESKEREHLTESILRDAVPAAREELRESRLDRLGEHQRAVYDVIAAAGNIAPGEAYERYAERVETPRSRRRMRDYVTELADCSLVEITGKNRGRRYSVVDHREE
ncbi:MAG: Cdc6/Cdc18 family protein [Halodesulfurarchaeum sp.]